MNSGECSRIDHSSRSAAPPPPAQRSEPRRIIRPLAMGVASLARGKNRYESSQNTMPTAWSSGHARRLVMANAILTKTTSVSCRLNEWTSKERIYRRPPSTARHRDNDAPTASLTLARTHAVPPSPPGFILFLPPTATLLPPQVYKLEAIAFFRGIGARARTNGGLRESCSGSGNSSFSA